MTEPPSRSPWVLLVVPGAVGFYALLAATWPALLVGPGFDDCATGLKPWHFIVLGSWLTGAILILAAITRRLSTSVAIAVTGILLIAAGALVVVAVVANDYHLCAS